MSIRSRIAGFVSVVSKAIGGATGKVAVGIKYALTPGMPGRWISDHREEANHVTGWNYVCIHTLGIQAMQADVNVFTDTGLSPQEAAGAKTRRKALRRKIISAPNLKKEYQEGSGAKPVSPDHGLVKLLQRPNPRQSGACFRYEEVLQLESTGNCLIYNVPNALGKTVERYVIPTAFATPVIPSRDYPSGAWRIDAGMSRYAPPMDAEGFVEMGMYFQIAGAVIPAEYVQVIRWPHALWKDDGYSKLSAGAVWSDTAEQMDIARVASLKNAVRPSMVVSAPEGANPTQEELEEASYAFNSKYARAENNGKVIFKSDGKIEQLGQTGREIDFQNTYPAVQGQMLALHTTPPVAVGIASEGSHAAFYIGMKQYTFLKVQPTLDYLAEEDTNVLGPQFGAGLTVEFTAATIDDPATEAASDANEIAAGNTMTVGEWRINKGRQLFGDERDDAFVGAAQAPPLDPNIPVAAAARAAAKPALASDGDNDQSKVADEHSTGISTKQYRIPWPHDALELAKHQVKKNDRLREIFGDPVLLAAMQGAVEATATDEELADLIQRN